MSSFHLIKDIRSNTVVSDSVEAKTVEFEISITGTLTATTKAKLTSYNGLNFLTIYPFVAPVDIPSPFIVLPLPDFVPLPVDAAASVAGSIISASATEVGLIGINSGGSATLFHFGGSFSGTSGLFNQTTILYRSD